LITGVVVDRVGSVRGKPGKAAGPAGLHAMGAAAPLLEPCTGE
jgi:hypothetical protein